MTLVPLTWLFETVLKQVINVVVTDWLTTMTATKI